MLKTKEDKLHKIPLRITDTTLRDAHQSLWATRMRTKDILDIMEVVDSVGFYSIEVWGGATFDVCLRFLRENPWERLRQIKAKAHKTPLQMLLRGQNLVGYRNYSDDLVDRFVALSVDNGMDIFRCFDALNDPRNLEAAIRAVKKYGAHAQGTLSYTISPVHTVEHFVHAAKEQVSLGIDSLCIKDMAGILSPISVERLVSALVKEINIPIQLHCHASSGMATATYVEGVRAGAGAIDCAISSMAGYSSQPPVETLMAIFKETHYSAALDIEALRTMNKYFEKLTPKRMNCKQYRANIDPEILVHQIPGGMISNFHSQLEQQGALDKLDLVLEEVSKVRKDLGWPPLVTPTSQIVGTQAVLNILAGERYKIVPNEVKEYVRGMYGRSPAPLDPQIAAKILGDLKPITHRPADDLEPMLPKAAENIDPKLITGEEDIVAYCILPEPALEYFKWRKLPADQRPPTPADLEVKKLLEADAKTATEAPQPAAPAVQGPILPEDDYAGISRILESAAGLGLSELTIQKGEFTISLRGAGSGPVAAPVRTDKPASPAAPAADKPVEKPKAIEAKKPAEEPVGKSIKAPFVGTFYIASGPGKPPFTKPGDVVNAGDTVCVVEAMKLFNQIKTPSKCKIVRFLVDDGQRVQKDQPLVAIEDA